jgi:hypothetical protein
MKKMFLLAAALFAATSVMAMNEDSDLRELTFRQAGVEQAIKEVTKHVTLRKGQKPAKNKVTETPVIPVADSVKNNLPVLLRKSEALSQQIAAIQAAKEAK